MKCYNITKENKIISYIYVNFLIPKSKNYLNSIKFVLISNFYDKKLYISNKNV